MAVTINKFKKNTLKNEETSSPEPPEEIVDKPKTPKVKKVKEPKDKGT